MVPSLSPGTPLSTSSGGQGLRAKLGGMFHTVAMAPTVFINPDVSFQPKHTDFDPLFMVQSFLTYFWQTGRQTDDALPGNKTLATHSLVNATLSACPTITWLLLMSTVWPHVKTPEWKFDYCTNTNTQKKEPQNIKLNFLCGVTWWVEIVSKGGCCS